MSDAAEIKMLELKRHTYYYPIGIISLIILPLILLLYSHNNPLLRERCIEIYAESPHLDDNMIYVPITTYNITKKDFPDSQNLINLYSFCAKQDSLQSQYERIVLNISREILLQDFITLIDRLNKTNHCGVFKGLFKNNHEYRVIYRYKDRLGTLANYQFLQRDYVYEYANTFERIQILIERNIPYRYCYLAQIFKEHKSFWFILVLWVILFVINILKIVKHHKMHHILLSHVLTLKER